MFYELGKQPIVRVLDYREFFWDLIAQKC
jgi:hypothetical protein